MMNPFLSIKNVLITLSTAIIAFFAPINITLLLVGMCIVLDTFFGIWRSYKTKVKITSRRLSHLVAKVLLYESSIVLIFVLEKYLLSDIVTLIFGITVPFFLTKMLAIALCSIEILSICESIKIATGTDIIKQFKDLLTRAKYVKTELTELIDKAEKIDPPIDNPDK